MQEGSSSLPRLPPLRKGKACISCRRRKMRCDGTRPVCIQCSSNRREMDCEYSDGFAPTRTELMEEHLANLQSRIKQLEAVHTNESTSFIQRAHWSEMLEDQASETPIFRLPPSWWEAELPPSQIAQTLVEIFVRHANTVGWTLNTTKLLSALSTPPGSRTFPHPALVNAIYLWGSRLSNNTSISGPQIERAFFDRSCTYLQLNLMDQTPQGGLQAVQTEILLATYLYSSGRTLEADYHINATVRLCLSHGMHRIVPQTTGEPTSVSASGMILQSIDEVDKRESISVFWMAFIIDRLWAIINNKPALMKQENGAGVVITTPLPLSETEYEQGSVSYFTLAPRSLAEFLNEYRNLSTERTSGLALMVKACILCECTSGLRVVDETTISTSSSPQDLIRGMDGIILNYIRSLSQIDGDTPTTEKGFCIGIHSIAYLSLINLHSITLFSDMRAYTRCLQAARYICSLMGYFNQGEMISLFPFVIPSIIESCKILIRDIRREDIPLNFQKSIPSDQLTAQLDRAILSLSQLSSIFPIVESQVKLLEELGPYLQSQ